MATGKADTLLHPVRMRIVQALVPGGHMTAQEIATQLTDVPQATLYRHLRALSDAGILEVVEEHPVRGASERVYALPTDAAVLTGKDLAKASRHDHLRYFITFLATLIEQYGHYLERDEIDLEADGVGYRTLPLNLSDDELHEMVSKINRVIQPYTEYKPAAERTRRMLSTVLIPEQRAPATREENA